MYPPQPARLHYPSFLNKMNMNEGGGVKEAIVASSKEKQPGRFWSQYNRIHNRLGAALGPGVPQERPVRTSYDPLTGQYHNVSSMLSQYSKSNQGKIYHTWCYDTILQEKNWAQPGKRTTTEYQETEYCIITTTDVMQNVPLCTSWLNSISKESQICPFWVRYMCEEFSLLTCLENSVHVCVSWI